MHTSPTPIALSPLDVVLLGLMTQVAFCDRDEYVPGVCEKEGCRVCMELMIQKGGHA